MTATLADVIKETTRTHLEQRDGLLFAQCISAVGYIGGTVPDCKGLVEVSTAEGSNSGLAVGAGLVGRRPIYVIRYQGFMWLAANSIVNYAAKSKEIWDVPCPVFVRSIGMEGNGIGPTASSCQHSLVLRMPGLAVFAPMTPNEWTSTWEWFMNHDDPVYCSEHRRSFPINYEMSNIINENSHATIIPISAARLNAVDSISLLEKHNITVDMFHLWELKPLNVTEDMLNSLRRTGLGVVIDSDFSMCGTAQHVAYELMLKSGVPVIALGLDNRNCGMSKESENITPSPEKITQFIKEGIVNYRGRSIR